MNRSPSALRRTPPSPRAASETSVPAASSGSSRPEGWNCTNSGSRIRAPAARAKRKVSPVFSSGREDHRVGVDRISGPGLDVEAVGAEYDPVSGQDPGDVHRLDERQAQLSSPVQQGALDL